MPIFPLLIIIIAIIVVHVHVVQHHHIALQSPDQIQFPKTQHNKIIPLRLCELNNK